MTRVLPLVVLVAALVFPRAASAQVHWDAALQVGVMKRFLAERPGSANNPGVGPDAQLMAHVALLPLVHAGVYVGHDISPVTGGATRDITFGGVRAKLMLPFVPRPVRAWLHAGFGYAGTYQRSYLLGISRVLGADGGFFEVPFGLGASYKVRKPWSIVAELGARWGFGHLGAVYEAPGPGLTPGLHLPPAGLDRFAVGLNVGVLLER